MLGELGGLGGRLGRTNRGTGEFLYSLGHTHEKSRFSGGVGNAHLVQREPLRQFSSPVLTR